MSNCKCNICALERMANAKVLPTAKISIVGYEKDGKFNSFVVLQTDLAYARQVLDLTDFAIKQVSNTTKQVTHEAKYIRGQWILREV